MNDRRLERLLGAVVEDLTRADNALAERLVAMRDAFLGWPASARLDGTGGARLVHWCWAHQRDVDACHREGFACTGEPMTVSGDPTGENAVRVDRAASDRARLEAAIIRMGRDRELVVGILASWGTRPANDLERQRTRERADDEGCWSCARTQVTKGVPRWEPMWKRMRPKPEDAPRPVCQFCWRWYCDTGRWPTLAEVDAHHSGKKIRRTA